MPAAVLAGCGFSRAFPRSAGLPNQQGLWKNRARRKSAIHCAEATGQYRLRAARMLVALLPDDVLARAVEAAEAQEHGVLEYAGPRESPAQGILRTRFPADRGDNLGLPTGDEEEAL